MSSNVPVDVIKQNAQCTAIDEHDRKMSDIDLMSPMQLRGITLANRIAMSPMCQYVANDGFADDWHLVHLGSRACGGVGLILVEATAVLRDGRITPGCLGLWNDEQVEPLARIVRFVHSQGTKIGIQLAHAGRKASCDLPWNGGHPLAVDNGGWQVVGPSSIPFSETGSKPRELDHEQIKAIVHAFGDAARRAIRAGFDTIEIHAAHGYLLHSFLSPISNHRTDQYGGNMHQRMRMLLEVVEHLRNVMPDEMPLLVRISATDWVEGGWDGAQSVELAGALKAAGVDLIDVSTGGTVPVASIPISKGYQVPFAADIRKQSGIPTGAVGLITEPNEANDIICRGDADLVFIGRQLLRDPYWGIHAQTELDSEPTWPISYGYAVRRRSQMKSTGAK